MERCPPDEVAACPFAQTQEGCFINRHHLYWPSPNYQSATEKRFRNLGQNVVLMCRFKHSLLHLEKPPRKPAIEVMRQAIEQARRPEPVEPEHWSNWADYTGPGREAQTAPLQALTAEVPPPLDTDNGL